MLTKACSTIIAVQPIVSRNPNGSAASAMRIARNAKSMKSASTPRAPISPHSSPSTEKMKSVYCSGR